MDKMICLGKNYVEHAKELGDAVPEKPVLFLKPPSSLIQGSGAQVLEVALPRDRGSVHPECEIVLRLNSRGEVDAYTVGLDMTLRDLQSTLKKGGHPWEIAKVFEGSALVGEWRPFENYAKLEHLEFALKINQQTRQQGNADQMTVKLGACVNYVREFFSLCEGDLIFTGTPAGVGAVMPGDQAELSIRGERLLQVAWK